MKKVLLVGAGVALLAILGILIMTGLGSRHSDLPGLADESPAGTGSGASAPVPLGPDAGRTGPVAQPPAVVRQPPREPTPGPAAGDAKPQTSTLQAPPSAPTAPQEGKPYRLAPQDYLGFGPVDRAQGSQPRSIVIEDTDPQHALRLLGVELAGLNRPAEWIEFKHKDDPTRGRFEITLRILPGAPPGPLRGRLVLTLSHPRAPLVEIAFSAVIR